MSIRSRETLEADVLRSLVLYDPETGVFTWQTVPESGHHSRSRNTRFAGQTAGGLTRFGYARIFINKTPYQAHRLAWLYVHGEWPNGDIDHIDRDRSNNRIANLRLATRSQNNANATVRVNSRSGVKGVSWDRKKRRWHARIKSDGRQRHVGYFASKEEAAAAYHREARVVFGEFASDGMTD